MSVIYECDGCEEQTKDSRQIKPVEVEIKSDKGQGPKLWHLCENCERTLRRQADPTTWPRAARVG